MTDNFEKKVAVDGPVVNAGELGSSTFSPGQALPAGPLGLGQRWTVARKREVVKVSKVSHVYAILKIVRFCHTPQRRLPHPAQEDPLMLCIYTTRVGSKLMALSTSSLVM